MRPQSVPAPRVEEEFARRVLGCVTLDDGWRQAVLRSLAKEGPQPDHSLEIGRVDGALANLRKQHLWGAVSDEEFQAEYQSLKRKRSALEPRPSSPATPDLERAVQLLRDLPALWQHPGVTPGQRRDLVRKMFEEIRLRDGELTAVQPRPQYAPCSPTVCGGSIRLSVASAHPEPVEGRKRNPPAHGSTQLIRRIESPD